MSLSHAHLSGEMLEHLVARAGEAGNAIAFTAIFNSMGGSVTHDENHLEGNIEDSIVFVEVT